MHPGRMLGGAFGIVMLVAVFFLPFWNLTTGQPGAFDSLYSSFRFVLSNIASIQGSGLQQESALAYVIIAGAALVFAAGVVGVYPRISGLSALVGMIGLTVAPFLLFPSYPFDVSNYGIGFWAIWALSIAALVVGGLSGKTKDASTPVVKAAASPAPAI